MTGYIGQSLLILAGINAFLGVSVQSRFIRLHGTTLCLILAMLWLIYCHVIDDFSLVNVFLHSHTYKPLLYKIAGAWGNHEGSFLLWLSLLAGCLSLAYHQLQTSVFETIAQLTIFAFLSFIILSSDPFTQHLTPPLEGRDLNPLLQDPLLAIHPPCLYLGYVCFAVPFLATVSHAFTNERYLALYRQWSLIGWTWLTLGIALGAFWAYYELGWGGWWAWDPVENAALIPWLSATAQIHILWLANRRQDYDKPATILMTITWASCLAGTILVRSGLLTSVHSFAVAPERGILLTLIASLLMLAGSVTLKCHGQTLQKKSHPKSKIIFIIELGCGILLIGWFTVLLGTLYPLISEIFGLPLTIGTPYFELTFIPLMLPLLMVMAYLPDLISSRPIPSLGLLSAGFTLLFCYWALEIHTFISLLAIFAGTWLVYDTVIAFIQKRQITPMGLAHGGLGLMIAGMTLTLHLSQDLLVALKLNHPISFASYEIELKDVLPIEGPNYTAQQAWIEIRQNNQVITILKPEKRYYHVQQMIHGETALYSHRWHHFYAVLGEAYQDHQWGIHLYIKPWINVMILGVIFMVLGGVLAFWRRPFVHQIFKKKIATPLILSLLAIPSLALEPHEKLADVKTEQIAQDLGNLLLCPTCSGQTLNDSPSPMAQSLRLRIRNDLIQGKRPEEIIEDFKNRFGPKVYRTPPFHWGTLILWGLPWIAFISMAGWQFIRHRQKFIV
ncbi:MAG TPA: cytochrome c-type biogenesis CcmF C-terminal domain-containing protein [Candidatus Nitrosotenuis sp.]|jgi:cytochrome c-type biogenesis protein CcmF|nr:cytochrome c-type biogenesis CcmF C-terminal domain-containing protein [Candidatus Nitrosotenuis sp.]